MVLTVSTTLSTRLPLLLQLMASSAVAGIDSALPQTYSWVSGGACQQQSVLTNQLQCQAGDAAGMTLAGATGWAAIAAEGDM